MSEIVKFLLAGDKFIPKIHLRLSPQHLKVLHLHVELVDYLQK